MQDQGLSFKCCIIFFETAGPVFGKPKPRAALFEFFLKGHNDVEERAVVPSSHHPVSDGCPRGAVMDSRTGGGVFIVQHPPTPTQ